MIIYILLSLILLLFLMMSCSVYINLKPPKSVILVALRMPYQMTSTFITVTGVIGIAIYFSAVIIKGIKPEKYSLVLAAGFCICCFMGIVFSLRITAAQAQISGMKYDQTCGSDTNYPVETEDLHEITDTAQCSTATPVGSPYAEDCVVYLNYGGWSAQDEKMGNYLQKLFVKKGYSYVRFAGIGKEQGNISDIVKDVKRGLTVLLEKKHYRKIVLIGGSAGGNIALITAFSNDFQKIYGESFSVNGVIALYPMTDMISAYDYFVERSQSDSWFGKLGDKLYCGLYGDASQTGTFSGETKKLDESVFGVRDAADNLYDEGTVINLIGSQNIPTLMIGGSADSMVVAEDTQKLYNYMKKKGSDCAYLELPNVEHAFDIVDNAARKRACIEMEKWVDTVFLF